MTNLKNYISTSAQPIRMAEVQKNDYTKSWQTHEVTVTLIHCSVEMQNNTATLEDSMAISYKAKQSYQRISQL